MTTQNHNRTIPDPQVMVVREGWTAGAAASRSDIVVGLSKPDDYSEKPKDLVIWRPDYEKQVIRRSGKPYNALHLSRDGRWIFCHVGCTSTSDGISIYDCQQGHWHPIQYRVPRELALNGISDFAIIYSKVLMSSSHFVLRAFCVPRGVHVYSFAEAKRQATFALPESHYLHDFTANEESLLVTNANGGLYEYGLQGRRKRTIIASRRCKKGEHEWVNQTIWLPGDEKYLVLHNRDRVTLGTAGQQQSEVFQQQNIQKILLSQSGDLLLVQSWHGISEGPSGYGWSSGQVVICIYDLENGVLLKTIRGFAPERPSMTLFDQDRYLFLRGLFIQAEVCPDVDLLNDNSVTMTLLDFGAPNLGRGLEDIWDAAVV